MSGGENILPVSWAQLNHESAGKKYQPCNGTEGELFIAAWCGQCQRDKSLREGAPLEECDDDERCDIVTLTMAYPVEDERYPKEWQYGADGQPKCTAFVPAGQPIPHVDTNTGDLFAEAAEIGRATTQTESKQP